MEDYQEGEEPAFLDASEVVEVEVDDDQPMEEEEDEEEEDPLEAGLEPREIEDVSKVKIDAHNGPIYAVASHIDANMSLTIVSGGGDDKAFLHRVAPDGTKATTPLSHPHTDSVSCVALNNAFISADLSKTPKLAAVGGYDGAIVLYDPDTGKKLKEFEGPSDVEWVCFHPKGGLVLLVGSMEDGTVWMYHIPSAKCMQVFVGHESGVTAGGFTPDGKLALSTSADGTLRVWAPRTGICKHVFRLGDNGAGLNCLATGGGPDGQLVIIGAEDGKAYVCHPASKKVVATLQHSELPANSQDEDEELEVSMSVEAVGFSPSNPHWCATGGADGEIKIWDLANNAQCRQVCKSPESRASEGRTAGGITRFRWHPSTPTIIAATADGSVQVWDARNGNLVGLLSGHDDVINDLDVSYNEDCTAVLAVTGGDDKAIRVFDTA